MADSSKDTQLPVLVDDLTAAEKTVLEHITHHHGYTVLIKIFAAVCARATNDTLKIDFEQPNAEHILSVRTQRARNFHECVNIAKKSIEYHTQMVKQQVATEEEEAVSAVAKRFGIHTNPKKQKEVPKQAE